MPLPQYLVQYACFNFLMLNIQINGIHLRILSNNLSGLQKLTCMLWPVVVGNSDELAVTPMGATPLKASLCPLPLAGDHFE